MKLPLQELQHNRECLKAELNFINLVSLTL
ncbi:hypothetical protein SAMN05428952_103027 [Nitrosomonas sp. Nm132]|jgi:hypothetical protein|nr:hypothetical protein SAMN05428952_103027 [Nitrosomonas sp. Nm132]SDZ14520.1 hypothetical protein SAMN05421754_10736 [Nitrosomonas sp. Nm58]